MRFIRHLIALGILLAGPALVCAWLVGYRFRDLNGSLMWFFFIPAPFVVAAEAVWFFLTRRSRARWLRWITIGLTAIPMAKIALSDMSWHGATAVPPGAIRVTHWNVARIPLSKGTVQSVLEHDAPDICVLSETSNSPTATNACERLGLTNHYYAATMSLFSRYPFTHLATLKLPDARGWCERVATPQGLLDILAIDLISKPQLARKPPMDAATKWIDAHDPAIPLLVIGDFNTLRESAAFDPFRQRLAHAYVETSSGWPYSWPLPLPVYEIDHAWYTERTMTVFNYELRTSFISDHRRQFMFVQLRNPGAAR